jgi:deoxyribonuclease IV
MLFGAHVSSAGGIDKTIDRIEDIGGNAVQVFTQSPRMWRATNHTPEAIARFRRRREEAGVESVVCHATYLINLGATDDVIYHKSVKALVETMETAHAIGSEGVIFHLGSHLGRGFDAAMHQVIPALQVVLGERDRQGLEPWLLIEDAAGHEGTMGVSLEELETVIDDLGRPDGVGICLDTCHLFASGYDIRTPRAVDALLDEVDERIGLDRLRALHINDSKMPFASRRDRHANVGDGEIGTKMGAFLGCPRLQEFPAVMETPGPDNHGPALSDMKTLRRLHRNGVRQWARTTSSR